MRLLRCADAEAFFAGRSRHIESQIAPPVSGPQRPAVCLSSDGQTGGVVMSKRIPLTQGKFAIVDEADFEWLNQWKWYAAKHGKAYYAVRGIRIKGKRHGIQMHRVILEPPPGLESDHINNDGLDNRRTNLRLCTRSQNKANSRKSANCSSRYKGVSWNRRSRKWTAYITTNYRRRHLGCFNDEEQAAAAYNVAARDNFKEFAKPNLIGERAP